MTHFLVRRIVACVAGIAAVALPPADALEVSVEPVAGAAITCQLEAVDRDAVRIVVDGESRSLPVADVRRIERLGPQPAGAPRPLTVHLNDGSWIEGDDLRWTAETAAVLRGGESIPVPAERVRSAEWRRGDGAGPAWRDAVPAEPTADLVAVSREKGFELVECAIASLDADTVTVVLDGDRIPVKRGKVLGLVWVRPGAVASGSRVALDGGGLQATVVEWNRDGLVLDGGLRMPPDLLRSIDYAAGRSLALATLAPEKVQVEPFFRALDTVEGLAAYFAPRTVPAADAGDADSPRTSLLMRPRTLTTWRIPPGSRRFLGSVSRVAAGRSAAAVEVAVQADGTAVWRRTLDADAGAQAIQVDVSTARRLTVEVDFVGGGMGCPVRLDAAVFEK